MSQGPWQRDPITGLPLSRLQQIDERYLNDDGSLNVDLFLDCNVFNVNTVCAIAMGPDVNVARVRDQMLRDPRCHFYRITDPDGRVITIATHINSAQAYGYIWGAEKEEKRLANLCRGRCGPDQNDVSSGSIVLDNVATALIVGDNGGLSRTNAGSYFIDPGSGQLP